jgi:hypothetical protein
MSKISKAAVVLAAVLAALAPGAGFAQSGAGRTAPPTAAHPAPAGAANAVGYLADSEAILREVAGLRGLAILRPVPSSLKSRADIEAIVLKDLAESSTPEEFATGTAFLRFLALVPPDFDLRRETVALLTEQIAGFYEPKTHYFYLADWIPIDEQRAVIAHELTHALADQHFDLRRFEKWPDGDSDAKLAAHALIEGEATAVMLQYSLKENGLGVDLGALPISLTDVFKSSLGDGDGEHPVYARAPRVLKQSLQFPYAYGVGLVQALLRDGSWKRVDRSYAAPPASTEQVMHPAKYLANERPVRVDVPDVSRLLGAGWRRADADVSGEFGYYLVLEATNGESDAARGAAGWAGDRYGFYVNDAKQLVTYVHRSAWDSVDEAREFFNAYTRRLMKRFAITADGGAGLDVREWPTPEGIVRVERSGADVLVIEGYRGTAVNSLVAELWNRRPAP